MEGLDGLFASDWTCFREIINALTDRAEECLSDEDGTGSMLDEYSREMF